MGVRFAFPAALVAAVLLPGCGGHSPIPSGLSDSVSHAFARMKGERRPASVVTLFQFNGTDGSNPQSPLVADSNGNLYGATQQGGSAGVGVAFELQKGSGGYTETVLYNFSANQFGYNPGALVFDSSGNLWGTTTSGVVELSPSNNGWTATLAYKCAMEFRHNPTSHDRRVAVSGNAVFAACLGGKIVKIVRNGSNFSTTVLHKFPGRGQYEVLPNGGLAVDAKGNVFGSSMQNGLLCCPRGGPTYELSRNRDSYSYRPLFLSPTAYGPLVRADGSLYETGFYPGPSGLGHIFHGVPHGEKFDRLTIFKHVEQGSGTPVLDSAGDVFFGDVASVEELVPSNAHYIEVTLATFSTGVNPLWMDASGTLYGATSADGGNGTIFEVEL